MSKPFRVVVTGSRDWDDARLIREALLQAFECRYGENVVVHGGADGADSIADRAAIEWGLQVETFPAQWEKHGAAAGPMRNEAMLSRGADLVLAFPDPKSKGTWDTIERAVAKGIPVRIYPPGSRVS